MTRDELFQAITDLGTITDEAERRTRLVTISDEVKAVYDSKETLTTDNAKLVDDNKKLQEYNMKLFLRVSGEQKTPEDPKPQGETPKYEDLFNEKGEIK